MRKRKEIGYVIGAVALAVLIWWLLRKKTNVSTSITFNGNPVEKVNLSSWMLSKMYPNEFIQNGKLCSNNLGTITCFDGDPVDVLSQRG